MRITSTLQARIVLSDPNTGEDLLIVPGGHIWPGDTVRFLYPPDGLVLTEDVPRARGAIASEPARRVG